MGWAEAAAWFVLALMGQAATLRMIDAGPLVHYQHYLPLTSLTASRPWVVAVIVLQTVLVSVGLVRRLRAWAVGRPSAFRGLRLDELPLWRVTAAILLTGATAAAVSANVVSFAGELAFAFFLQLLSMATIVLMVTALPDTALTNVERRLNGVLDEDGSSATRTPRRDWFGWIAAAVTLLLAIALSMFSYERHPHLPDEVVYLLHARYFAEGKLAMPAPAVPAAFDLDLMHYESDRWFSPVSPGWPAALAVGVLAGVPWLVNPLLAAVNVLLTYRLLSALYSRRLARYATALLAVSPWFLFLAMSFMTHMLTLTCALVAALGVLRARRTGKVGAGVLAGAAVGATSLVRPLDGVIVGALTMLWSIGVGGRRLKTRSMAGLAVGTIAVGALVFLYNRALTGDPLTFPINAYFDKYHAPNANDYGFGPDRGLGWPIDPNPGHGPVDGFINTHLNISGLNTDLFGWSVGSLIFVFVFLCAGTWARSDRLMIAAMAVIVAAYFFYYFSGGPDFGARYWFPMIVPLVALSARGIEALERVVAGPRVTLAVAALMTMSLASYVPWRAVDKYHHYRGMQPAMRTLAAANRWAGDLVLVRGERFPDYASAAVRNPTDLSTPETIYAWDRDERVRNETLRAYPNRRVWIVDGPSITRSGYQIRQGPVSAAALHIDRAAK